MRRPLGTLQVGLANSFEEGLALLFEAIQTAPCGSSGQPDFDRQIEDQGQVRAQVALDELFQLGDTLDGQATPPP